MNKLKFRTACKAVLLLALLLPLQPSLAKPLENSKWFEARTAHFTVRSLTGKSATIELLKDLELLRAGMLLVTPTRNGNLPSPDMIYVVQNMRQLYEIGYSGKKRTLEELEPFDKHGYVTDADGHSMLVVFDDKVEGTLGGAFVMWPRAYDTAQKYIRYVLNITREAGTPDWYEEGIAQYFSLSNERLGKFEMGRGMGNEALLKRWQELGDNSWYTIPELLTMTRPEHVDLEYRAEQAFHAQSWLLVHYLMTRRENTYSLPEGLQRYQQLVNNGGDAVSSFATAFALPVDDLQTRLFEYLSLNCCAYIAIPLEELLTGFKPQVSRMSRAEVSLGLARLAAALGRTEPAERWYTVALEDDGTKAAAEQGIAGLQATPRPR